MRKLTVERTEAILECYAIEVGRRRCIPTSTTKHPQRVAHRDAQSVAARAASATTV